MAENTDLLREPRSASELRSAAERGSAAELRAHPGDVVPGRQPRDAVALGLDEVHRVERERAPVLRRTDEAHLDRDEVVGDVEAERPVLVEPPAAEEPLAVEPDDGLAALPATRADGAVHGVLGPEAGEGVPLLGV